MTYTDIERRRFGRRKVFKVASVSLVDGRRVNGIVVDISEGGLRIQSSEAALIHGELVIEVAEDDVVYKGRSVHSTDNSVGVEFTHAPQRRSWRRTAAQPTSTALPVPIAGTKPPTR